MDQKELLLVLLKLGHDVLEGTMEGVSSQVAQWAPPGLALPIGATYLHIVMAEDSLVNGMVRGLGTLFEGAWGGKTGASELRPMDSSAYDGWARRVQVDVAAARAYGAAVYATTEAYVRAADPAELDRLVGERFPGGAMPVAAFLASIVATHACHHTGEISALKGEQGLKGYPY
ncbi:MAG: DinB family protein [Dehalococcoidia bacterium]|nr:DinB family protein [Dehalococcoidia bacterium]